MSEAETLYHTIAKSLPDATPGKMFGAQCLKAPNGKALAFFYKDHMVFKLTGDAELDALALGRHPLFQPDGRPDYEGLGPGVVPLCGSLAGICCAVAGVCANIALKFRFSLPENHLQRCVEIISHVNQKALQSVRFALLFSR